MPEVKGFHCIIKGRVQGVGFRAFAERHAVELGLTGYVRNTSEGHVEIHAEGKEAALNQFLSFLKRGPSLAQVRKVDVEWLPPVSGYPGFEVRF